MRSMETLHNDRFIRALLRKPVDKTPVWVMRQAGRYLPEYREVRAQAGSFLNLMQTPELACEVTLQPLRRFDFDASILFSDILTIPHAMDLGLSFKEGEGPVFERPLRTQADIERLTVPNPLRDMPYVYETIKLIKAGLQGKVPLIGFAGSPWTLATYMIEGGSTKTFSKIKGMMYEQPEVLLHLLQILTESVTTYLNEQINAGVDAVMIFDTWGGVLSPACYEKFSLAPMRTIIQNLHQSRGTQPIPSILFTKNGGQWLEKMAATGCSALGLDWTINIAEAKKRVGHQVALQGNLDPCALYASPATIRESVQSLLNDFGSGTGHVFNLGHGINPDVNPDHVKVLVDSVHELSV
jgi:uroporphyrinogen decarboxylase